MPEFLEDLTEAQLAAVTHMDGPMLVVAGAGSGKTRVVTRRIAYLITQGVRPGNILAMTFTNKAAEEMAERIAGLIGTMPRWIGTFHSICAKLLRERLDELRDGRTRHFSICDSADQLGVVKQCMKKLEVDTAFLEPRGVHWRICAAKRNMIPPSKYSMENEEDRLTARIYQEYERFLRAMNGVDFDDLLLLMVRLLRKSPDFRMECHRRFMYLLIDEYQDTNRIQYELTRMLAGPGNNVHVTGDPDQSIYSWRGAAYANIVNFTEDFPGTRVVRLEQNYRSTQTILNAANCLISNNTRRIEKELFTENHSGDKVNLVYLPDNRMEAEWVAQRITELRLGGVDLRDMAVFYRTNAQSRLLEEALMRRSTAYQVVGGIRFYERKEIKDLLAHLKLLVNPGDIVSLERVINCRPTGVGAVTLAGIIEDAAQADVPVFDHVQNPDFPESFSGRTTERLRQFADHCRQLGGIDRRPVGDCVYEVMKASGLMDMYQKKLDSDPSAADRIENLNSLVDRAYQFQSDRKDSELSELLEDVALVSDVDYWDHTSQCVSLMTLHSAKGLEFSFVFIVGAEEQLLPHRNSDTPEQIEEERRLFYVGLTRAEQEVTVTHASERQAWGRFESCLPSRFLGELPEDAVSRIDFCEALEDGWDCWE